MEVNMVLYIAIGVAAGIISGMGIGGGTILIPALTIFLQISQQSAQNMNLIYFIPTAAIALCVHAKQGNIEKKYLTGLIITGLLGAAGGSFLALKLKADWLRKTFGGFLFIMGVLEIRKKK